MIRIAMACVLAVLLTSPAPADTAENIYQTRTIVTGERAETRTPGIKRCFMDALVKVSGDRRLPNDPKARELAGDAQSFVTNYTTRDRMFGKPLKDEQGTRDRPYDLNVDFDPVKLDAALAMLGRKPWPTPRPRLMIFLAVKNTARTYLLADGADLGSLQREAFQDAAVKYGVPVGFPSQGDFEKAGLSFDNLPETPPDRLQSMVGAAAIPLRGTLIWDNKALGWIATWHLLHDARDHTWSIKGVNFDAAFRDAVSGAAQVLSGNGEPG